MYPMHDAEIKMFTWWTGWCSAY